MKPVLFVTNHAPDFRVGAFQALHEAEDVVFALVGGGVRHGGRGQRDASCRSPSSAPASARSRGWPPPGASGRSSRA